MKINKIHRLWLFVFLLSTGCVNGLLLTTPPNLQLAMDSAGKLKAQAEDRVKLVNLSVQQGKVNPTDLEEVINAYESSRGLFSQWIDKVQADLKTRKIGGEQVDYNALSQNAADKAKEFNALVDKMLSISARGNEIETIKSFINAGVELGKTINEMDTTKRQELILTLEALRWKPYQSI
jgi:hypothetical protein